MIMKTTGSYSETASAINTENILDTENLEPLRCWDCNVNFQEKEFLFEHLKQHIRQPKILINPIQLPRLTLTLKSTIGKEFEIVSSSPSETNSPTDNSEPEFNLAEEVATAKSPNNEQRQSEEEGYQTGLEGQDEESNEQISENDENTNVNSVEEEEMAIIPQIDEVIIAAPIEAEDINEKEASNDNFENIPGAEPTPPPELSPDLPKIRIKTTGLLKEAKDPLMITELDEEDGKKQTQREKSKPSGSEDILSLINNNERAKDFGFTTSDSEFLPADERIRPPNALQLYSQNQMASPLAGLPMEALAQQVSRLQPSNGMHQQNVLINIQQFPQAPPPQPPPPYQPQHMYHPPAMYHHHHQPPYQPYQPPPPPNPMYYPPAPPPGYAMPPPRMMAQPQRPQPPPPQQQQPYRQAMRQQQPQQRGPGPSRQRAPMSVRQARPQLPPPQPNSLRSIRPPGKIPSPQNNQMRQGNANAGATAANVKRKTEPVPVQVVKRKKIEVLTPDKDDDDCQVICMQPKNTDGGLPQIESVQGGTMEPENNVMHLSDSITLSVRNPQPRPSSPKKSDAKAVANILATRGITVTATPKTKPKSESQTKASNALPPSLNLNGAVSIIPKSNSSKSSSSTSAQEDNLPTVDLTDDTSTVATLQKQTQQTAQKASNPPAPQKRQVGGLPFKCDLCPAQYPTAMGLSKHRQNYHKTSSGMCEIGVPLINLKQAGIFQKLSALGINNYIPLHQVNADGFFALPIINARNANGAAELGATTMLTLGPVRNIPRPNGASKQLNQKSN